MAKSKKPSRRSGGAAMRASGRHVQLLGWLPDDWAIIRAAADLDERPATQFVQRAALAAAKLFLEKSQK